MLRFPVHIFFCYLYWLSQSCSPHRAGDTKIAGSRRHLGLGETSAHSAASRLIEWSMWEEGCAIYNNAALYSAGSVLRTLQTLALCIQNNKIGFLRSLFSDEKID